MSAEDGNTEIDFRALWHRSQNELKELKLTQDQAVTLAARALLLPILDLLEKDAHQFSERPCSTCQAVSALVGQPFGCSHMAQIGKDAFLKLIYRSRT